MGRKLVAEASGGPMAMNDVYSTLENGQHEDSMDCSGDMMEVRLASVRKVMLSDSQYI